MLSRFKRRKWWSPAFWAVEADDGARGGTAVAPGEFYPLASDAARRYQRVGEFAFQSLTSGMAPIQQIPPAA